MGVMYYKTSGGQLVPMGTKGDKGDTGAQGPKGDDRVKIVAAKPSSSAGYAEGDLIVVVP